MYEPALSTDLKFLLPGDSLTVFSHKSFPEQFEFVLHYVDRASGELKSVIAPHQSRLRALLAISRPSSSAARAGGSHYHQVTFTAPSNGKTSLSGFVGSFYKKAGLLELCAEQERSASAGNASPTFNVDFSFSNSTSTTSSSSNSLRRNTSAPTTPANGSPRSESPTSSSDEIAMPFASSSLLTSSFSSSSLHSLDAASLKTTSASRRHIIPVAMSFRTRITSNGKETTHSSPLFVICDSISQVDLSLCRTFKKLLPETYPLPTNQINAELPAKPIKKASAASSRSASDTLKKERSEKVDKTEKAEKTVVAEQKEEKTAEKSDKKSSEKKQRKRKSSKKEESSATTQVLPARCNTEVPAAETSRFHVLKFW